MIKSLLMTVLFLLFFNKFYAQTITPAVTHYQKKYFESINKINRLVYEAEYAKADSIYSSLFLDRNFKIFQIDYSNALIIADIQADEKKLSSLIKKLIIEKGCDTTEILRLLPNIKQKQLLWKEIQNNYSKWKFFFNSRINTIYSMKMEEMFEKDQIFHIYKGKPTKVQTDQIDSIDQCNLEYLKILIKEHGFPSEFLLGGYIGKYEYAPVLYTLFRHFIQNGEFEVVYPIIKSAVENGDLHPSIFANLCDLGKENIDSTKMCLYNYQSALIEYVGAKPYMPFIDYSRSNFDCINTNRINIGLDSFHIAQKQFICQGVLYHPKYKLSRFIFIPYVGISQLPSFLFENDKKALENNTIESLEKKIDECPCICK